VNRSHGRLIRLATLATITLVICGPGAVEIAQAQQTYAAESEELIRWANAEIAKTLQGLSAGPGLPPPSAAGIASALDVFSTSPLTGGGTQPPGAGAGGATGESPPQLTIQLPPHPPERYAPAPQWRPPVQMPDPSTIPSPPQSQAPPQQQRPPIQLPFPPGGSQIKRPPELPTIPLPPHPPEEQAPWRRRG
jgi:hypothetical protein